MAHGYLLQAEYESGYVLTEDEHDHSPFDPGKNIFNAILNNRPTDFGHGRMVSFSLIGPEKTYTIDWTPLWDADNPRPIYYRKMRNVRNLDTGEQSGPICDSHHFGYQYLDQDGNNQQEIMDIV